ncbi:hypothetical protein DFJ74DRAFT_707732 [Hyaloraphidium curvatum]|nr:hypothetical protein DFJ74DRAFT_707732 [Hyaloraphidium curvatum]
MAESPPNHIAELGLDVEDKARVDQPGFSNAEWAALFPASPPLPPTFGAVFAERHVRPKLPLPEFLSILSACKPLHALVVLNLWLAPWARRSLLRNLLMLGAVFVMLGALWHANTLLPHFSSRNYWGGFSAMLSLNVVMLLLPPLFTRYSLRFAVHKKGSDGDVSGHNLSGVVRWTELVGQEPEGSPLLAHEDGDGLCPCPACVGDVMSRVAGYSILDLVARICLLTVSSLFGMVWTMAITFGEVAIGTWWGILSLVVIIALWWVNNGYISILGSTFRANVASLELSRRLQRRAVWIALDSLVSRHERNLFSELDSEPRPGEKLVRKSAHGEPISGTLNKEGAMAAQPSDDYELYQQLHEELSALWRQRFTFMEFLAVYLGFYVLGTLLAAVTNVAVGNCVPAYVLGIFAYLGVGAASDMVNVAVANQHISGVTELYRTARRSLRELSAKARRRFPPTSRLEACLALIEADDRVLKSYMDVDQWKGRVLGFVVTFATLRSMAVTMLTVGVALWSILRGGGTFVTLDFACPGL